VVPLFKSKGDAQDCGNYRAIKLLSHTFKIWERIIEARIRQETSIADNQFGFMPGRGTMDAIFSLRILVEKFREKRRPIFAVFIDLEKAYDRVPRDVIWWALQRKNVPCSYVRLISDMYDESTTYVRTVCGYSDEFGIGVGLHQGSSLSPYLFLCVIDELTSGVREEAPWTMLFADDVALISESRPVLQTKLDGWRVALENKGLKISRTKTEFMVFGPDFDQGGEDPAFDGTPVKRVPRFRYLGTVFDEDGEIDSDITHRTTTGWMRWREASGVLCDRKVPMRLKGKFYKTAIRPALMYGAECWAVKKKHEQQLHVTEMRMLRAMCGVTREDHIRNTFIRGTLKVAPIKEKLRSSRLRWLGHVERREVDHVTRRVQELDVAGRRGRGRPKKKWSDCVRQDLEECGATLADAVNRVAWRRMTHAADPD
jgi:hypothetical protein